MCVWCYSRKYLCLLLVECDFLYARVYVYLRMCSSDTIGVTAKAITDGIHKWFSSSNLVLPAMASAKNYVPSAITFLNGLGHETFLEAERLMDLDTPAICSNIVVLANTFEVGLKMVTRTHTLTQSHTHSHTHTACSLTYTHIRISHHTAQRGRV